MIENGIRGANTQTGAIFEKKTDLVTHLKSLENYECKLNPRSKGRSDWHDIYFDGNFIASSFEKHALYNYLETQEVKWKGILSKKLLPDDAIYVIKENTIFIIEVKYQTVSGSVDEKLQTCGFKLIQYKRLFAPLNHEVEYLYILNDWFKKPEYKDVLDYILYSKCKYYFNYIPLQKIGLPVPIK
jgi:hypothetical protein